MNDTAWEKVVDAIDAKFGISDHGRYTEPLEDKPELTQTVNFICFEHSGQTYKLERVSKPAVLDRKSHYHKAAGTGVRFENVYDPDSLSYRTNCYIKDGDNWEAIDPSELSL